MVKFPGRFESLAAISAYVEEAARQAGFDSSSVYAVQLAVDEACANIIDHAYGGEGKGDIECACVSQGDDLQVILHDHGRPFDPTAIPLLDPKAHLETCTCGGAGLYLIQKIMDEVRFEFDPQAGNTCILTKRKNNLQ